MVGKVRVIDILTDEELMKIEECETNIIMARTPFEIRRNRRRALEILARARERYASKYITVNPLSTSSPDCKVKSYHDR